VSPLEEHEDFILGLIKEQPDMTLDEIVAAMKKAKIAMPGLVMSWRTRGVTVAVSVMVAPSSKQPGAKPPRRNGSKSAVRPVFTYIFLVSRSRKLHWLGLRAVDRASRSRGWSGREANSACHRERVSSLPANRRRG
jgi:hypothetical protein